MKRRAPVWHVLIATSLFAALGCDEPRCPTEAFVVEEHGTCSSAPQRLTIASEYCRVSLHADAGAPGLPPQGALGQEPAPLRQGGFFLYTPWDSPAPFRLCRARRVEFRLELSCVGPDGAPVCDAVLTEPDR